MGHMVLRVRGKLPNCDFLKAFKIAIENYKLDFLHLFSKKAQIHRKGRKVGEIFEYRLLGSYFSIKSLRGSACSRATCAEDAISHVYRMG